MHAFFVDVEARTVAQKSGWNQLAQCFHELEVTDEGDRLCPIEMNFDVWLLAGFR